jgi:single-strand DNA-binding protein
MNHITIYGNLGKDPEVKTVGEKKAAKFSVATTRRGKDKDGNKITDWHRVVLWDKLAELSEKYLTKGSSVIIEGEVQYGSYVNKDGQTVYTTDIIGNQMHFVGKKEAEPSPENNEGKYQKSGKITTGSMSDINQLPGANVVPENEDPF